MERVAVGGGHPSRRRFYPRIASYRPGVSAPQVQRAVRPAPSASPQPTRKRWSWPLLVVGGVDALVAFAVVAVLPTATGWALAAIVAVIPPAVAWWALRARSVTPRGEGPRHLGGYTLIDVLGQGGMGAVWRAEHQLLGRPAAVKLIHVDPGQAPDPAAAVRFEREARMTAQLTSPHAVRMFDFGIADDGTRFLAMELLAGRDLEQVVAKHGAQPSARVAHLLIQACDALQEAHDHGLIHRDVKPSNFIVRLMPRYGDWLTVLDFGLGLEQRALARGDGRLTAAGHLAGTPAFMAPEQARPPRGGVIDHRVDIYALGCVAYFLLSGRELFSGTPMEVVAAQVVDEPTPIGQVARVPVPAALAAVVMDCLAKDPMRRPASAAALAQRLVESVGEARWTPADAVTWWRDAETTAR